MRHTINMHRAPKKNPIPNSGPIPVANHRMTRMTRKNRMVWTMNRIIAALYTLVALFAIMEPSQAASLLPNGEQTFLDSNGAPLASGSVYFYVPSTSTPKDTWQDSGQNTLNTNPVLLDSAGRAIIYGSGTYRQVVKDVLGNTIWDQLTADPSGTTSSWGGTSGGTANAQTVSGGGFSASSGQVIWFLVGNTNTASTTLQVGTSSPIAVYKDISTGPSPLTGGELVANNVAGVVYDGTAGRFHLIETPGFISTVPANVAAATTTNILGVPNAQINITGAATISSFGTTINRIQFVTFAGINTLTYNATTLKLPGQANIVTAAGDTAVVVSDASGNATIVSYSRAVSPVPSATPAPVMPSGHLSLTTGTPFMAANVTAATSVFWVPFGGTTYPSYNGTIWTSRTLAAQLTLALDNNSGHTGYQQSGKNFDLFLYNDAGTDRLVSGPAWTSDTARASAISLLNGVYTNTSSMTAKFDTTTSTLTVAANQGTYVGTIRASADGQTVWNPNPACAAGGGNAQLYLWNLYNSVTVAAASCDNTDSWVYSTATWRAADAGATGSGLNNRISIVRGLNIQATQAAYNVGVGTNANVTPQVSVALDSITVPGPAASLNAPAGFVALTTLLAQNSVTYPGLGFHFFQALEISSGATTTWDGDNGTTTQYMVLSLVTAM